MDCVYFWWYAYLLMYQMRVYIVSCVYSRVSKAVTQWLPTSGFPIPRPLTVLKHAIGNFEHHVPDPMHVRF